MPSTWSTARHIIKSEGFGSKGLLKGITATLGRHGLFNAVYFGSYYNMKRFFVSPEVKLFCMVWLSAQNMYNYYNKATLGPTLTRSYILTPSYVLVNMKPRLLIFCIPSKKYTVIQCIVLLLLTVYVSDAEFYSITAFLRISGRFFLQFS